MAASTSDSDAPPGGHEDAPPAPLLYVGHGIVAVDKPAGVPVHAGTGHERGLLEEMEVWASMRPGVVPMRTDRGLFPLHRLDRETSGVLVFGLGRAPARRIQKAFAEHRVRKRYLAFVAGPVDAEGTLQGHVRSRLRGRYRQLPSSLSYRRLAGDERLSLVEVVPGTGRTHQIRVLFAEAGRPLAGDLRYGRPRPARQFLERFDVPQLLLHALELELDPEAIGHTRLLVAPPPATFRNVCEAKGWDASVLDV